MVIFELWIVKVSSTSSIKWINSSSSHQDLLVGSDIKPRAIPKKVFLSKLPITARSLQMHRCTQGFLATWQATFLDPAKFTVNYVLHVVVIVDLDFCLEEKRRTGTAPSSISWIRLFVVIFYYVFSWLSIDLALSLSLSSFHIFSTSTRLRRPKIWILQ